MLLNELPKILIISTISFLTMSTIGLCEKNNFLSLDDYLQISLKNSDMSLESDSSVYLANLNLSSERHLFSTKIIPLANFGINNTTANQSIGLKLEKKLKEGQIVTLGASGTKVESEDYLVVNSHNIRSFLQVSQPIFRRWGERYNTVGLQTARHQLDKQALADERVRQETILNALQRYYSAVLSSLKVSQGRKALERSRQYLEVAQSRYGVGLVSKADVYRAELAVLNSEASYLNQVRARDRAHEDLAQFANLTLSTPLPLDQELEFFSPLVPEEFDPAIFSNRPDWQAQLVELKSQRLALYAAERDLLPDLSLNFLVEQRGRGDSFSGAAHLDETQWAVMLQLNSAFDNFQERAAVARVKHAEARLRRETDALRRQIRREVREALLDLKAEARYQVIAQKSREQAEKALDLALTRYERGLTGNLELLDAEAEYAAAEIAVLESGVDYNLAAARLGLAMGVLSLEWLELSTAAR